MKRQLTPMLLICALSTCASAPGEGPEVRLGTQRQWMILSDASSMDRMNLGDIVITNSRQVLREWQATQSLWARMQSRVMVLPRGAYATISERSRQLSCSEVPPEQPGRLGLQMSDGRGHEATCVLIRPASCQFVGQVVDGARRSAVSLEPLVRLRRNLACSP